MSEMNQGYDTGEEVGTLLIANDKNNVISNKLLRYFQCLTFRNLIMIINFLLADADLLKISIFYGYY